MFDLFLDAMCPKIYFNRRCFSGAYLSKGRITKLPKYVPGGPVPQVMKTVIKLIMDVGYKPSRVYKIIQPPSQDISPGKRTVKVEYR